MIQRLTDLTDLQIIYTPLILYTHPLLVDILRPLKLQKVTIGSKLK